MRTRKRPLEVALGIFEPEHYDGLGEAALMYLHLLAETPIRTGLVRGGAPQHREVWAALTGQSCRTVSRWWSRLRSAGYIQTQNRGRLGVVIRITHRKWWRAGKLQELPESPQLPRESETDVARGNGQDKSLPRQMWRGHLDKCGADTIVTTSPDNKLQSPHQVKPSSVTNKPMSLVGNRESREESQTVNPENLKRSKPPEPEEPSIEAKLLLGDLIGRGFDVGISPDGERLAVSPIESITPELRDAISRLRDDIYQLALTGEPQRLQKARHEQQKAQERERAGDAGQTV